MDMSAAEIFSLKAHQYESAAELRLLQMQLQGAVAVTRPGVLRDAAFAEMTELAMLIEEDS